MKRVLRRLGWRLFWSVVATVAAFGLFQPLALASGVPEVAAVLPALAVVFWVEMSLTVMRILLSPRVDFQDLAFSAAAGSAYGGTVLAVVLQLTQLARMGVVLWIVYGAR